METPYIQDMARAIGRGNGRKPAGRKVWSIDLETVWLPFFTATNTMGDTRIPHEALGAPLRLAYDADGSVKFSERTGKPVVKVVKEVADSVRLAREYFAANLAAYAHGVALENPEAWKAEVQANLQAGKPIVDADRQALQDASAARILAQAQAEVEKAKAQAPAQAEKPKAKPRPKAKATKAPSQAEPVAEPEPEREAVAVA